MFAILENGSVETMLRYRLRFSTGRAFAIPTGQSKTRMTVMTLRSCARTFIAGPTMSIIESFLVLWRLVARARQSAPSGGNGRRVISVDRPLRLRTAPRERPGCSPASLPPEQGREEPEQKERTQAKNQNKKNRTGGSVFCLWRCGAVRSGRRQTADGRRTVCKHQRPTLGN